MKSVIITGVDRVEWTEIAEPEVGPRDVLLRMRACGICGSDAMYASVGGFPPHQGAMPLGHEPAAEGGAVGAVHGEIFGAVRPASTMVVVKDLLDPRWKVEMELDAVLSEDAP